MRIGLVQGFKVIIRHVQLNHNSLIICALFSKARLFPQLFDLIINISGYFLKIALLLCTCQSINIAIY